MTGRIARPRLAALAVLLATTGAPLTLGVLRARAEPAAPPIGQVVTGPPAPDPDRVSKPGRFTAPAALRRSIPQHLDIPTIGVHTDLMSLGQRPDGTVEVPPLDDDAPAGWYRHSVTPGEVGSAVILGHVDSARDGPAVFYRLATLEPGDRIAVRRADRSTVTFIVDTVRRTPKTHFPTDAVYGRATGPVLHLVTCGGRFDRRHGTYRENVIVTASVRNREPAQAIP